MEKIKENKIITKCHKCHKVLEDDGEQYLSCNHCNQFTPNYNYKKVCNNNISEKEVQKDSVKTEEENNMATKKKIQITKKIVKKVSKPIKKTSSIKSQSRKKKMKENVDELEEAVIDDEEEENEEEDIKDETSNVKEVKAKKPSVMILREENENKVLDYMEVLNIVDKEKRVICGRLHKKISERMKL